ncbi:MAG: NitT/TauT family transport system permease protein [Solirubrobacteraceae bacterium]|nr:NitT/TauT family transport system permease protein [Solirubrobacteraceae bacterium]
MTAVATAPRGRGSQRAVDLSKRALAFAVAVALGLVAWEIGVWISDDWVPSIGEVGSAVGEQIREGQTWDGMAITAKRILIAFSAATVIGIAIGFAMGLSRYAEAYFRPLIVIALAIPDPVYVILAILVLGTEESSGVIALTLALVPFVVTIVHTSVAARETQLDEMSRVYRFGRRQYLTQVLARQVAPALLAAARTSFAFAWKIVVLVEALSQPEGIGAQIYYAFRLLKPAEMIALALIFIVLMRLVDYLVFGTLERRLLAWSR